MPNMDTASSNKRENEDSKAKNATEAFTIVNDVNKKCVLSGQYARNNVNVSPSVQLSSLSSSCSEEATSLSYPPDGGWGWVVVFASFMISLIADGISLSFGILFVDLEQYFGEGKSKTSWVGSIFLSMPLLAGPIASYLSDRYGCQRVCIAGALLATAAFIVSVCADSLEVLFITFSIAGLGLALCYVTSIVIVAYYFEKKRSLATGLSACGTGIGTFVFPPLIMYLLGEYGWRGTLLILSGFFLNMVAFGALMRDLEFPQKDCRSSGKHSSSDNDSTNVNCPLEDSERLCSSLVQLPTYLYDNLPVEVISELSSKEGGYLNSLVEQHPYLLNSIVIGNDKDITISEKKFIFNVTQEVPNTKNKLKDSQQLSSEKQDSSLTRNEPSFPVKLDAAYLHNMRLQRGSITYRGAMLNIRRYRLRASSCPDIYRNSLVTISENKTCIFFQDLKELLVDMFDLSIFKNFHYTLFCLSNFVLYACVDVPYVYIPDHASNQGVDLESASFLISILGVLNTLGMVIVGYVADKPRVDSSLLYSVFIIISGLMLVIVPVVNQYYSLASLVGIYGFTISANYTLVPIIIVNLISLDSFIGAYGLLLLVQGIASLVGPPIAGFLFDMTGDYYVTFVCTGICIFISGVMVFPFTKVLPCRNTTSSESSSEKSIKQNAEIAKVQFQETVNFVDDENNKSHPKCIEINNVDHTCNCNNANDSCFPKGEKNEKANVILPPKCNVNLSNIAVTENHSLLTHPRHKISSIYENPFSSEEG